MKTISLKNTYESLRPLIVWLVLTELVWISYWLLRMDNITAGYTTAVIGWLVGMLGWFALVIFAGRRGFFLRNTRWLSNLVGVVMVLTFATVMFGAVPAARKGLVLAACATTYRELASIHILRLLAIGTIIKYFQRELPLHFVTIGSFPDFLFAISAVLVAALAGNASMGKAFFIAWHSIGILIFFGAGISMFFSVPSPFRLYYGEPDASIVFRFPMLLAPNLTVPLFMLAHAVALVKLAKAV